MGNMIKGSMLCTIMSQGYLNQTTNQMRVCSDVLETSKSKHMKLARKTLIVEYIVKSKWSKLCFQAQPTLYFIF